MTDLVSAARQALEALKGYEQSILKFGLNFGHGYAAIAACEAALAEQPAAPVGFARVCEALPEGVNWGDPLTPAMARHIFESAIPPGCVVVPVERIETATRIIQWFAERNPKYHDRQGVEQDPYGAHAWLAARPGEPT